MKTLLIIVTGSGDNYYSEHARMEPFQKEDNVDVAMVFWGDKEYEDQFWKSAKYIFKKNGNKFHLLRDFFSSHQELQDEYDRFMVLDDDIYLSRKDFITFLEIFETFDFDLACPAFITEPGGAKYHKKPGMIYRTLNCIDVGAFCMNKAALRATLPIINASLHGHGWGIPEWWIAKYHYQNGRTIDGGRMGCIDAVGAEHTRRQGANVSDLRDEFGSQRQEKENYLMNFVGRKFSWWKEIKEYEKMSAKSLKLAIDKATK